MSTEEKIREIEKKIESRRRDAAREEARRDAAKAELKKLLKQAQEDFGAKSVADLERLAREKQEEAAKYLRLLEEMTDGL